MPHNFTSDPTVTITIPASHAKVLANWASVSRTIQSALSNKAIGLEELEEICPALDAIHQLIRTQLWSVKEGHEYYKTRLEVAQDAATFDLPLEEVVAFYVSQGVQIR